MSGQAGEIPTPTGDIVQWPKGFAMTLGYRDGGQRGLVRCCEGHDTPEAAKHHGLVRLIEVAQSAADRDIALWAKEAEAS